MRRGLYRNVISYLGGLVMVLSLLLILSFLLLSFTQSRPSPYLGIFTYMIFPAFLALGFLISLYGMVRENRRERRLGVENALPLPTLDLNNPQQRKKFAFFLVGAASFWFCSPSWVITPTSSPIPSLFAGEYAIR